MSYIAMRTSRHLDRRRAEGEGPATGGRAKTDKALDSSVLESPLCSISL
jgi:hypothetical protein